MVLLLFGDDDFGLQAALKQQIRSFAAKHGDLNIERLDGSAVSDEQILAAMQSLPFLSPAKLVVISSLSDHKALFETFDEILPTIPDEVSVILVEPKPDKRAKYYKTLQKTVNTKEFSQASDKDLPNWATQYAKTLDGQLSLSDAHYLVQRVGTNKMLLAREIEKLIIYNPQISRQTIDELCEPLPQSTVFQLLEATFAGNHKRALALYQDQRRQRVEPAAIIGMIAWQLHILAVIKTAGAQPVDTIAKSAKLHPFVVRKNKTVADTLSTVALKKMINDCVSLDVRIKTEPINADDAVQHFLLSISRDVR